MSSIKNKPNYNACFLKKPVKIVKQTANFINNTNNNELKSVSANYLDKKYSLAMNVNLKFKQVHQVINSLQRHYGTSRTTIHNVALPLHARYGKKYDF